MIDRINRAIGIWRAEGLKRFLVTALSFITKQFLNYLLSPVAILVVYTKGRSLRDALYILNIGKPADRIDALLGSTFPISPIYFDEEIRLNHIYRYLFSYYLFGNQADGEDVYHLDVACGVGYGSEIHSDHVAGKWVGVDVSRHAIRYAMKYYGGVNSYIQGDLAKFPVEDNTFDSVTCFETLEHIDKDRMALRELKRVLNQSGELILSVPYREDIDGISVSESRKDYPHVNTYDVESLNEKLKEVFPSASKDYFFQCEGHQMHSADHMPYGFCQMRTSTIPENAKTLVVHVNLDN